MAKDDSAGIAKIKKEFIAEDHVKVLSLDCVAERDKRKLEALEDILEGGSKKKFKKNKFILRGQNKVRGPTFVSKPEDCLCPYLKDSTLNQTCDSGKKCKFMHSIEEFLRKKPEDIGEVCYVFEEQGYCPMGLTCRYGSSHIDADGKNIVKEEVYKEWKEKGAKTINVLSNDLRNIMRKREYNYEYSESVCQADKQKKELEKKNQFIAARQMKKAARQLKNQNAGSNNDIEMTSEEGKNGSETKEPQLDSDIKSDASVTNPIGAVLDLDIIKAKKSESKKIDWKGKLYLSPLTTLGNLPFRRLCKKWGADITCSEMAFATEVLKGAPQEHSLLKRHESEDLFGIQLCGNNPFTMSKVTQLLQEQLSVDFIDVNMGCPIEFIYKQGSGCGLLQRPNVLQSVITCMSEVATLPITVKTRTGIQRDTQTIHNLMPKLRDWGASLITLHGRTREQRYTKQADWDYIERCAQLCSPVQLFGNGDILTYEDYVESLKRSPTASGVMIGRGALIKPWIFSEIKEQKLLDISAPERFDILKDFVNYGLEHWGSDTRGVENTRRFFLEWLSFYHRYIPVGILESTQKMNQRPPIYHGRNELETLLSSSNCSDWIKISEMLLGKVPPGFAFLPKHKANSWK